MKAIFYAFLAAVFYAINIPASKVLLRDVGPTTMASLLYLGAGIGIAILSLLNVHDRKASAPLTHRDMPYRRAHLSHAWNQVWHLRQRVLARQLRDRGYDGNCAFRFQGGGLEATLDRDCAHHACEHPALVRGNG